MLSTTQLLMLSTTQLLMLSMLPQLIMSQESMLPQLIMPQLLMQSPPMLTNHTPTPTELLMTTQRLTSMLLRLLMLTVLSLDLMMLLFPMVAPSTSSTPLTTTMDMSLMLPMKESQFTQRLSLPLPTMLKPSLCFVNIYQNNY